MTTYSIGTRCFCDFHFGGKPSAKVIAVITPGTGKDSAGKVRVKLTETIGAYKKGETLELPTWQAVPKKQEFRKAGSCFRWVNTNFNYA